MGKPTDGNVVDIKTRKRRRVAAQRSSIARLPPSIKDAVDAAVREGRASTDDIVALIKNLGGEASRSAVGRYRFNQDRIFAAQRQASELSKIWVERFGREPDGDVGRLISEMLKTVVFEHLAEGVGGEEGGEFDPGQISKLANAIHKLAGADKLTADRILKVRREASVETAKKAAAAAVAVAGEKGLSADTVALIRQKILGVAA
jgi:hypothetical protein